MNARCKAPSAIVVVAALSAACASIVPTHTAVAQVVTMPVETPASFDSRGRVLVLFPRTVSAAVRDADWWPLTSDQWREARLYSLNANAVGANSVIAVLAVVGNDGAISRFGLTEDGLRRIRAAFDGGTTPAGTPADSRPRSGVELSQPAGNTFVRNQTFLGLAAYGPATAAILSKNSASATGGYFLAAGSSFFVAARMVRTRTVTRSQTILGTHGGLRGGAAGAVVAAMADAETGSRYGVPILIGALGGTVGGFLAARNMSDGEAASAGLGADMFALTTLGTGIALDAFESDETKRKRKIMMGINLAAAAVGYAVGPQYARRASYNVTAGDASVALTGAVIGAAAGAAITDIEDNTRASAGFATAGLVAGFIISDRLLVSRHDRTSSDAAWAKLGAGAGALMGTGVAIAAKTRLQSGMALAAVGGALGLVAADRMIAPARDGGAARGVLRTGAAHLSPDNSRIQLSLPGTVAAVALLNTQRSEKNRTPSTNRGGAITNLPALRITF